MRRYTEDNALLKALRTRDTPNNRTSLRPRNRFRVTLRLCPGAGGPAQISKRYRGLDLFAELVHGRAVDCHALAFSLCSVFFFPSFPFPSHFRLRAALGCFAWVVPAMRAIQLSIRIGLGTFAFSSPFFFSLPLLPSPPCLQLSSSPVYWWRDASRKDQKCKSGRLRAHFLSVEVAF